MNAQMSLRIGTDSTGPTLYAFTRCECVCKSDQNEKLSLSHSCVCMFVTGYQRRLRRACAFAQISQALQFMHTPSVEVCVGPTKMRCQATSHSCIMHFSMATSEGSDEPEHWHRLTRGHTLLCIHQVLKFM